ncbi:MAG: hypothetical protein ABI183_18145 [Polyangiaceae bacterium]
MNQVTLDRYVDAVAAPLDGVRRAALGAITKSQSLTRVVARRDARVPFIAAAQIMLLFAVTATRPLWLFVLGPIVLGIPHLASDVRYLVLRQRVAREVILVACAASALFVGIRVLDLFHAAPSRLSGLEVGIVIAWFMVAIASGARERKSRAPLFVLPLLLAFGCFAASHAGVVRIVFAHAHNLIGIAAWIVLFRKNKRAVILPALALTAATALLLSGATLPFTTHGGLQSFGFDLSNVGRFLAPGASPQVATAVALSFVFLQSVHYATWLVWIPQDSLPGEGTFTFRMTARSLVSDFGILALAILAVLALALAVSAVHSARSAVSMYMSLATFHGYFEIAILAYFAARGRGQAKTTS